MPAEPGGLGASRGYAPPPYNWTDRGRDPRGQTSAAAKFDDVLVIEEFDQADGLAGWVLRAGCGQRTSRVIPTERRPSACQVEQLSPEELAAVREEALALETRANVYGTTPPAVTAADGEGS
jgi:hypothetical protein